MKRFVFPLLSLVSLGLTGCTGMASDPTIEPTGMEKNRSALDLLRGPNVDGVDKTLLDGAIAAEAEGNMSKAVALYQQVYDRKPEDRALSLAFANALRKNNACNDSLVLYEKLLKKDAKDVDALEGKGMCLMAIGEGKEAGQAFTNVLAEDPNRWRTLNAVGVLFAGKGKVPEAIAYFEKAASLDSAQIAVMNNLGLAYLLDKRYDQAIETFTRAQKRLPSKSPDKSRIDMNLALAYALAGDMDNAQKFAKPHVSEAGLYNNLGFFAKLSKDEQLARDYLNMALSKSTVYYKKAWENLGTVSRAHVDHGQNDYGVKVQTSPAGAKKVTVVAPKPSAKPIVTRPEPVKAQAVKTDPDTALEPVAPAAIPTESAPVDAPTTDEGAQNTQEPTSTFAEKKFKELSMQSDMKLRSPEATSLERIEPPEENRLAPNQESWFQ